MRSMDPTVKASGSDAGDFVPASLCSFPAATTTNRPAVTALATALLSERLLAEPKDMLATLRTRQYCINTLTSYPLGCCRGETNGLPQILGTPRMVDSPLDTRDNARDAPAPSVPKDLDRNQVDLLRNSIICPANGPCNMCPMAMFVGVR